jgi:hypothetical protein
MTLTPALSLRERKLKATTLLMTLQSQFLLPLGEGQDEGELERTIHD